MSLLRFSHSDYKPRSKTKMSATGKRERRLQHEEERNDDVRKRGEMM